MKEIVYTDPVDMPDDERMTAAEFKVIREFLGFSGDWLSACLHVEPRTGRRWEAGTHPIPDGVRLQIEALEEVTAEVVTETIEALRDARDPAILTYRTDEDYLAHVPSTRFPASWHRAVVARVAQEVPGLAIGFWTPGSATREGK